jgi:para-aminobenzoate synthetase/4-amino-4-deoxychorismate lyase
MNRRHSLPAEVYALLEQTPATVLLEGGKPDHNESNEQPWTRLFTAPVCVCVAYDAVEIPALFAAIESAVAAGQSAAGFFSYECGSCFEPKASMGPSRQGQTSAQPLAQPLAWFGIYPRSYIFDHKTGKFVDGEPPELAHFRNGLRSASGHDLPGSPAIGLRRWGGLSRAEDTAKSVWALAPEESISAEFALTEAEYAKRIARIHEWIRAGDVYQLNFTAPFRLRTTAGAAALYAHLRARQPVEYGAFLHWQAGRHILSYSPELFFRVDWEGATRRIVTRPMKGTAPRGRTTREDREIAAWLANDPKNRAENVMIVDLERNDIGRLAQFGSVRAEKLFAVERLPTLWQMTSTVSAELRPEVGFHDIFRALFPCGSITGAPKVRAMQLLGELEDGPRGVYTGAIGFFSPRQTVFNVAIRTLDLDGGQGTMGAGGGIVIDSNAADEFRECMLKAEFLTRGSAQSPEPLSLIETMLWNGNYPFIEMHLDRLADSAGYFGFPFAREAVKAALETHAQQFARTSAGQPRKVRLLLLSDGELQIADEVLAPGSSAERVGRVRIAKERTDPTAPLLYHKTTHRAVYAQAFNEAAHAGYDDVLFLNLRGEVTEGAISSIIIEKDSRWLTPPIDCGLLPGVYRRHLLETRPGIEERVLHEEDLRTADAIYLTNAVRGLRRVEIE